MVEDKEKVLNELKELAENPTVDISDIEKIKLEIKGLKALTESLEELLKLMESEEV